jgi:hypothetical protein
MAVTRACSAAPELIECTGVMSLIGTNLPIRNVRYTAAFEGKAEADREWWDSLFRMSVPPDPQERRTGAGSLLPPFNDKGPPPWSRHTRHPGRGPQGHSLHNRREGAGVF